MEYWKPYLKLILSELVQVRLVELQGVVNKFLQSFKILFQYVQVASDLHNIN